MTNVGVIGAAVIVAASIAASAWVVVDRLTPLTPTKKCWDLRETFKQGRAAKDPVFTGAIHDDPQELFLACLVSAVKQGGG